MKNFRFILYIRNFEVGRKLINAKNADEAYKKFQSLDLPFHTVSTIQIVKPCHTSETIT